MHIHNYFLYIIRSMYLDMPYALGHTYYHTHAHTHTHTLSLSLSLSHTHTHTHTHTCALLKSWTTLLKFY